MQKNLAEKIQTLPASPGIYFFKDKAGNVLYVGKANSIKKRVKQHFQKSKYQSPKNQKMIELVDKIDYFVCESEIEALILEAYYIKKLSPKFNIIMRDDKNYFFVGITKEEFPRIFITHQKDKIKNAKYIGPFTNGSALKSVLNQLRKILPFRHCKTLPKKPCLQYHLDRCPAPCINKNVKNELLKNTKNITDILQGKKRSLLKKLQKEMLDYANKEDFKNAQKLKSQIENIEKIFQHKSIIYFEKEKIKWQEVSKELKNITNSKNEIKRVECFDISNIQGTNAVGSMAVFIDGIKAKNEYRKFKIKFSKPEPNDPKMMQEVLKRRLSHKEWPAPDLIILDGGKTQLNAVLKLNEAKNLNIITLAKKNEEIYLPGKKLPASSDKLKKETKHFLQSIRDEAHRFAVSYHRVLRKKNLLGKK